MNKFYYSFMWSSVSEHLKQFFRSGE